MFNHLHFANRTTLYLAQGEFNETRTYLDCAIRSDDSASKERVIEALKMAIACNQSNCSAGMKKVKMT